jgi:hydroxyacylglutathione hydrolase
LARWTVPVYIGQDDIELLQWRPARRLTAMGSADDDHCVAVGALEVNCMVTPGHTPGGFCYRVRLGKQDVCFVGDTLFAGSVGRANPFSLYPQHLESLRRRLLTLPDATVLLPGHGPGTTVAEEREHNPFAAEADGTAGDSKGQDHGR